MFKLSQLSKLLHARQRKKLLSKFRTKSSVNTFIASRSHPTVVAALKLRAASKDKSFPGSFYSRKYRIDLFSQIKPIASCWLYGIGICFSPNNLKRKARCGSDLLGCKLTKWKCLDTRQPGSVFKKLDPGSQKF